MNSILVNSVALGMAGFVFALTMFLAIKHWIGFSITFLLLLFALSAGVLIANHDIIRDYLKHNLVESPQDVDLKVAHFHEQVLQSYDALKTDVEMQKHKLQVIADEIHTMKNSPSKTP
jgi:hypothetical protein